MKSYHNILFDLDGTLTDSSLGITNSVAYALSKYGIEVNDNNELKKFIGPPLVESFEKFYKFSNFDSSQAVKFYREYYSDKGIFENFLYEGIEDLLIQLTNQGQSVLLATSKPEYYAKIILNHFNIDGYFSFVAGSNMDGSRVQKQELIAHVLDLAGIRDKASCIMIGDREYDIIGAKHVGIDSMGVLFGFGSRDELQRVNPEYLVINVNEIKEHLLK
ncbi:MAG: HAD family hydrolase [Chitinophagales bacterium]|nr:HAD family hydrolase [Chitinophagales bacterium]MCZ2393776.1 HAD family hydrolase [Chitinophagales bacterium]